MKSSVLVGLVAVTFWLGSPADGSCGRLTGRTLEYVCGRLAYTANKFDCLAAGKNQYLDECALGACDRFNQDEPTVACIHAIAGQVYTLHEVLECDGYESPTTTVKCFRARGQSYARVENLKAARRSGERHGTQLALEAKLDDSAEKAAAKWAPVRAQEKAGKDRVTRSWNQGYTKARESKEPSDAQAFAVGLELGNKLAVETASTADEKKGFFEARKAALQAGASETIEVDLKTDRTSGLFSDGLADLGAEQPAPPAVNPPVFPLPEPLPAIPPTLTTSDSLPWTPNASAPADTHPDYSPCDRSDFDCRSEFLSSFKTAYQAKLSARYREAFVDAFNSTAKGAYFSEPSDGDLEAFNQGATKGSSDRGILEGFEVRYPTEERKANSAGRTRFATELSSSYFLQVKEVSVRSRMGRSLAPGYAAEIVVEIENLGQRPSPSGLFRLRGISAEARFENSTRFLPSLAPGTKTTLRNALSVAAKDWELGKSYPLEIHLEKLKRDGAFEPRGSHTISAQAKLAVEVVSITPRSDFGLNTSTSALLRMRNSSEEKLKGVSLSLQTAPQSADVINGDRLSVPDLQPGEEWETEVLVVPNVWTHDLLPTLFRATVRDANQQPLSWQKYSLPIDLKRAVSLSLQIGEGDVSNRTVQATIPEARFDSHGNRRSPSSASSPFRITLDCRQDIRSGDGYEFRYEGASQPGSYYTGTTSAPITSCKAGQRKTLSQGRLTTNFDQSLRGTTSALRFKLKQNGFDIQGVQVFIAVH